MMASEDGKGGEGYTVAIRAQSLGWGVAMMVLMMSLAMQWRGQGHHPMQTMKGGGGGGREWMIPSSSSSQGGAGAER